MKMLKDRKETGWRKCGKCIADGRPECDVSQGKTDAPESCRGPYRNFNDQKRRERRERKERGGPTEWQAW